jgi:hypothetical protein
MFFPDLQELPIHSVRKLMGGNKTNQEQTAPLHMHSTLHNRMRTLEAAAGSRHGIEQQSCE